LLIYLLFAIVYIIFAYHRQVYRFTKKTAKSKFGQSWSELIQKRCMDMCMEMNVKLNMTA